MTTSTPLQNELRQKVPFRSQAEEGVVGLLRTADVVRRVVAAAVEPRGITPQQYNVLRILRGAGDEGLPTLEIAARMIETAPGITRLLDRLETKGLVERKRCERDRRQVLCWISGDGLALLSELDTPVHEAGGAALRDLSSEEIATLMSLLDRIRLTSTQDRDSASAVAAD